MRPLPRLLRCEIRTSPHPARVHFDNGHDGRLPCAIPRYFARPLPFRTPPCSRGLDRAEKHAPARVHPLQTALPLLGTALDRSPPRKDRARRGGARSERGWLAWAAARALAQLCLRGRGGGGCARRQERLSSPTFSIAPCLRGRWPPAVGVAAPLRLCDLPDERGDGGSGLEGKGEGGGRRQPADPQRGHCTVCTGYGGGGGASARRPGGSPSCATRGLTGQARGLRESGGGCGRAVHARRRREGEGGGGVRE